MWRLFYHFFIHLFSFSGASETLCFVIVAFPGHLHLYISNARILNYVLSFFHVSGVFNGNLCTLYYLDILYNLLQHFFVCVSVVSYATFVLVLIVSYLSFVWCLGRFVLRDCGTSWVYSLNIL